jgi:hypothetical protein
VFLEIILSERGRASSLSSTRFELTQVASTAFLLRNLPGYGIEFTTQASGNPTEAILTLPSQVLTLPRI